MLAIELWQESGLPQLQFCKREGIPFHIFRYWLKKYRDGQGTKFSAKGNTFLPVQVNIPEGHHCANNSHNGRIDIIYPNGVKLSCPVDTGKAHLRILIKP